MDGIRETHSVDFNAVVHRNRVVVFPGNCLIVSVDGQQFGYFLKLQSVDIEECNQFRPYGAGDVQFEVDGISGGDRVAVGCRVGYGPGGIQECEVDGWCGVRCMGKVCGEHEHHTEDEQDGEGSCECALHFVIAVHVFECPFRLFMSDFVSIL